MTYLQQAGYGWRDTVLAYFSVPPFPSFPPLILVADPDGLLLEEQVLAALSARGYDLLTFADPIAFRYFYCLAPADGVQHIPAQHGHLSQPGHGHRRRQAGRQGIAQRLLLADSGRRVGGLVGLEVEDVDLERSRMLLKEKGGKLRYGFFSDLTKHALFAWLEVRPSNRGNRWFAWSAPECFPEAIIRPTKTTIEEDPRT